MVTAARRAMPLSTILPASTSTQMARSSSARLIPTPSARLASTGGSARSSPGRTRSSAQERRPPLPPPCVWIRTTPSTSEAGAGSIASSRTGRARRGRQRQILAGQRRRRTRSSGHACDRRPQLRPRRRALHRRPRRFAASRPVCRASQLGETGIATADGSSLDVFDGYGRHVRNVDALQGFARYSLAYDSNGYLIGLVLGEVLVAIRAYPTVTSSSFGASARRSMDPGAGVLRVACAQFLADLLVGAVPEAAEVLRHLHGAGRRGRGGRR